MRKLWALLLVAAMLAAALPAALATEELEEYRITILREINMTDPFATDDFAIGKIVYDKYKIALEYVPFSGDWTQYCALRLAGRDYPEIMQLNDQQTAQAYIDAGALLSFDDYKDLLPDFFSYYPEYAYDDARSYAADGKMYFFTGCGSLPATSNPGMNFIVRSDLVEEQGWPFVYTASEWLEFFKTAKANHPTTAEGLETFVDLPLGEVWGFNTMFNDCGHPYGNHIYVIDWPTYTVSDRWTDPVMREFMAFWNQMWREHLLDPECFTDKCDQMISKSNTTQCLASWYARWLFGNTNQSFIDAGTPEYQYIEMPFTVDSTRDVPAYSAASGGTMATGFGDVVVTTTCKYPERVMELLNYLHTDEGRILVNWGVEGEDWYINPETGKRDATPELVEMYVNDQEAYKARGFGCFMTFSSGGGQNINQHDLQVGAIIYCDALQAVAYTQRQLEAVKAICGQSLPWDIFSADVLPGGYEFIETKGVDNAVNIPAENVELIDMQEEILDYTFGMIPKIIMAESDEEFNALYDECVEGRQSYGIDTIISWMQEQAAAAIEEFDAAA